MPSRKSSRNHNDYPASTSSRGYSNSGYTYPIVPGQPMHYGSYNPYGTADRRQFRDGLYNYDSYRRGEYATGGGGQTPGGGGHAPGGGGPGVEDKWRNTYPYVPTSYYYHSPPPRPPPESIGQYLQQIYHTHSQRWHHSEEVYILQVVLSPLR